MFFSVPGLQFGVGERFVSNTGSVVQADRIDSEFLYPSGCNDIDVHADCPALGGEKTKSSDGHYAYQLEEK